MDSKSSGSETASDRQESSQPFGAGVDAASGTTAKSGAAGSSGGQGQRRRRRSGKKRSGSGRRAPQSDRKEGTDGGGEEASASATTAERPPREGGGGERRRKKSRRSKKRQQHGGKPGGGGGGGGGQQGGGQQGGQAAKATGVVEGMIHVEKANHAHIRLAENQYRATKKDVHVSPRLVQRYQLRDGAVIKGPYGRGQGKHKFELRDIETIDGRTPQEARKIPVFKNLTSIDPDFHYEVGDPMDDVSLRVLDLICPVGRGQRGLIVAPPRSGKTILMQSFAKAIEKAYPEVHLVVLLVDERPEEATEWRRSVERGQVFVSTNDEMAKTHVELAEAVWRRCKRMVELGEDVVLLLDSITRLARAYNHVHGSSGKTMSGGLDSRAMERPRQFFGTARNTETAGSLTILGTTLIETGSRMDQLIFEEFKGTGNMELVLSRKLADRRIFPAIDVERSGTRKEEKLIGSRRLKWVHTLRRVLTRMHFAEAMELLITRLEDVEKTDDFLQRFEIDPDA